MSPKQCKKCILCFSTLFLLTLVLIRKQKQKRQSHSGHKAVMDLGDSQSKIKCPYPVKFHNFQVISQGKLSSFTLISTELPLIFSAGSGPFWQEAEALEEHCFGSQPSSVKCHNLQVISLSSFTLISTELPLIFSSRSGPSWQEAESLKKYCFCFSPQV